MNVLKPVLITVAAISLAGIAGAAQPFPHMFYGNLSVDGSPADAGTVVSARAGGEIRGEMTTEQAGAYGGPGTYNRTLVVEGNSGEQIRFFIDGVFTGETTQFVEGASTATNLSLTLPGTGEPIQVLRTIRDAEKEREYRLDFPSQDGRNSTLDALNLTFAGNLSQAEVNVSITTDQADINGHTTFGRFDVNESFQDSDLDTATIRFLVRTALVDESDDVVLFHDDGTGWELIEPRYITASGDYYVYEAEISHFSTFAAGTNEPPNAVINASATDVYVGESVSFDGLNSSDPDGSISSYSWDFDNGKADTGGETSTSYASAGDYTVELTVEDNDGATDTDSTTISVSKNSTSGGVTAVAGGGGGSLSAEASLSLACPDNRRIATDSFDSIEFSATNTGDTDLDEVLLLLSGLDADWYTVEDGPLSMGNGTTSSFNVSLSMPETVFVDSLTSGSVPANGTNKTYTVTGVVQSSLVYATCSFDLTLTGITPPTGDQPGDEAVENISEEAVTENDTQQGQDNQQDTVASVTEGGSLLLVVLSLALGILSVLAAGVFYADREGIIDIASLHARVTARAEQAGDIEVIKERVNKELLDREEDEGWTGWKE
jgi:PGF-pre-PGF domain-containing protein